MPSRAWRQTPALSNPKLFARDRGICAYCGHHFKFEDLTREHIVPTSRGGHDTWMNCITACRPCNGHKGNRMPEEARMSLMYLPYVPSLHEDMILRGRRILADQMEFLLASVPRHSRLHGVGHPHPGPLPPAGEGVSAVAPLPLRERVGVRAFSSRRLDVRRA